MRTLLLLALGTTALSGKLLAQAPPASIAKVDCKKEIREASDLARLEELLSMCPKHRKELGARMLPLRAEQQRVQAEQERIQVARETEELGALRQAGASGRFAIPVTPGPRDPSETSPGAITIGVAGDQLTVAEGSVAFGGRGLILPTMEGSIYRFDGKVDLSYLPLGIKDHVAVGEGPLGSRLAFALLGGQLVYLRGRGKVVVGGSREVVLGQP